jgi:DNA-binding transcriptional MerR regulator
MEPDLISKKDLLLQAGISYGQLYRWKRKGLIPEEWFVRKSAFTGQETFFPREKMVARVQKILSMKEEDLSLDDIADAVSPSPLPDTFARDDVEASGIASDAALALFAERHPDVSELRFEELLAVSIADSLLRGGEVGLGEARDILVLLEEGWKSCEAASCDVVLLRKMGVPLALITSSAADLVVESGARIVARVNVPAHIEELKTRLNAGRA